MRNRMGILTLAVSTAFTLACGPSKLSINPARVVNVSVQPASGQALFCPGDAFQIELVAKLDDGTLCSNVDGGRGCMNEKNAIIDPSQVRIEASPGAFTDMSKFVFTPPVNPLETADGGILLKGFVQDGSSKSIAGERRVSPVYDCQREYVASIPQQGTNGEQGRNGPDLTVTITSLSTPWFSNAALIRVENGDQKVYFISASADRPVRIVSKGQDGGRGAAGAAGGAGADGAGGATACAIGASGAAGSAGAPGGDGGNGGAGGAFKLVVDDAKAELLKSRVKLESIGGAAGAAGPGGAGGAGGKGGAGGPAEPATCPDGGTAGSAGSDGNAGPNGKAGQPGAPGPTPTESSGARATLFASEMATIAKIEAAKAAAK